jgi:TrpR-related protein YerC/YecD
MILHDTPTIDRLYDAILALKNRDECAALFEDLCTIKEVQNMAQRLEVAVMLDEGKNYQAITRDTSVSTATISRVSRCLNYGSGGYRLALERMKKAGKDAPNDS